jgi:hypothetical protein
MRVDTLTKVEVQLEEFILDIDNKRQVCMVPFADMINHQTNN